MSFDSKRVDLILQYALLLAGEEEDTFDRQLGPIHLIKYVYLADILFAEAKDGETFTGANWIFHSFGPWDAAVFERIDPALSALHADKLKFDSKYGDEDWVRYHMRDTERLTQIERQIPPAITMSLSKQVHKHLSDTPSLLDYVYKTKPMLAAAPGERLDFSSLGRLPKELSESEGLSMFFSDTLLDISEPGESFSLRQEAVAFLRVSQDEDHLLFEGLSNKKRKRFHEALKELRKKHVSKPKLIGPPQAPRFDEVFEQGLDWLDELAGSPKLEAGELTAEFSDDVWKSSSRKGEDVS